MFNMGRFTLALIQLVAAVAILLLTGCETVENYSLTCRLWDNGELSKFSEPAPNPKLALFESTNHVDVLVHYDALSDKHSVVTRRSYCLRPNQATIEAGQKPKWAEPPAPAGLQFIPVLSSPAAATNLPPEQTTYAVPIQERRGFSLYRSGVSAETFELPVYEESSGMVVRVTLTPFAVTGDTLMLGAVAGVVGFCLWVQGGATH